MSPASAPILGEQDLTKFSVKVNIVASWLSVLIAIYFKASEVVTTTRALLLLVVTWSTSHRRCKNINTKERTLVRWSMAIWNLVSCCCS